MTNKSFSDFGSTQTSYFCRPWVICHQDINYRGLSTSSVSSNGYDRENSHTFSHVEWMYPTAVGTVRRKVPHYEYYDGYKWVNLTHYTYDTYSIKHIIPLSTGFNLVPHGIDMKTEVVNKFINKATSNDIDLGTLLGELPETATYALNVLSDIVKIKKGIYKRISDPASAYLEFLYAVKPMIEDVHTVANIRMNGIDPPKYRRVQENEYIYNDSQFVSDSNPYYYGYSYKINMKHTITGKLAANYIIDSPNLVALKGFGLENPASIAWDLFPLSFVADWFIPIGTTLRSLSYDVGTTLASASYTYCHKKVIQCEGGRIVPGLYYPLTSGIVSGGKKEEAYVRREILSSIPSFNPIYEAGLERAGRNFLAGLALAKQILLK